MGKPPRRISGKKPPAPSVKRRPASGLKRQIANEIYTSLERLDADPNLLAIVGSWCDTLDDEEILQLLREWNQTGKLLHRPQ
jgi:hypothetical protein